MARSARQEYLGIAQWLELTLDRLGVSKIDFARMAGIPTSTMTEILQAKTSFNSSQTTAILNGLEKIGINLSIHEWTALIAACQPMPVHFTAKSFVKAWEQLPGEDRREAGLEISRRTLDNYEALISSNPASVLLSHAANRLGRTPDWIAEEYELPPVRMSYLRSGYKIKLSSTEVERLADAVSGRYPDARLRKLLEDRLMVNQAGDPAKFIELIDLNFEKLKISSLDDLVDLMSQNECSLSNDEALRLLEALYLEREPINLNNRKHNLLLSCLSVILVNPKTGKKFRGGVDELVAFCGMKVG